MYIYKDFEVPRLNQDNLDIIKKMRLIKIKYLLIIIALLIFDSFVFSFYILNNSNSYVKFDYWDYIVFWIIFFVLPFCLFKCYKLFTEKSEVKYIEDSDVKIMWHVDGPVIRPSSVKTKPFRIYTLKDKNGKRSKYRIGNETSHNLCLKSNGFLVKYAGLKFAVAVNNELPEVFICANCGTLNKVEAKKCYWCNSSLIKIFTRESYNDALEKTNKKLNNF